MNSIVSVEARAERNRDGHHRGVCVRARETWKEVRDQKGLILMMIPITQRGDGGHGREEFIMAEC